MGPMMEIQGQASAERDDQRGMGPVWWVLVVVFTAVAVVDFGPGSGVAHAQSDVLHERVGLYLLDISDFSVANGAFKADMFLTFRCDRPCDPHFDFRNGSIISSQPLTATDQFKEYRVRAQLQERSVDLRNFPFTKGSLGIDIEDDAVDSTRMMFEVDAARVDRQVNLPGFELGRIVASVDTQPNPVLGGSYSSLSYEVGYSSHRAAVAVKDLLPLALLTLVGVLSFVVDPEDTADRVLLALSALLTLAFFGSSLTQRAPNTDYLTFADKYVGLLVVLTVGVLAGLIVICDRRRTWDRDRLAGANRRTGRAMFALWVLAQVYFAMTLFA